MPNDSRDGDEFSELAKQLDFEDPSPFVYRPDIKHNGQEMLKYLQPLSDLVVADLVEALNETGVAIVNYLGTKGLSVTTALTSPKQLFITIDLPGDANPFVVADE